jgi:hypothetical protein
LAQDKAKDAKEMKAPKDAKAAKAEKGKVTQKMLHEDDKVRAFEVTFKPGDEGANVARSYRIVTRAEGGDYPAYLRRWQDGEDRVENRPGESCGTGSRIHAEERRENRDPAVRRGNETGEMTYSRLEADPESTPPSGFAFTDTSAPTAFRAAGLYEGVNRGGQS